MLFADTPDGSHASALIYSLVETAKANGLEPYLWLRNVMRDLPAATTADHYDALPPCNQKPADLTMAYQGGEKLPCLPPAAEISAKSRRFS